MSQAFFNTRPSHAIVAAISVVIVAVSAVWIGQETAPSATVSVRSPAGSSSDLAATRPTAPRLVESVHSDGASVGSDTESSGANEKRREFASDESFTGTHGRGSKWFQPWDNGWEVRFGSTGNEPGGRLRSADRRTQSADPAFRSPIPVPPGAAIPAAFREFPADSNFQPQKSAALEQLQQSFIDAIGGTNQNPGDPAYVQRWIAAQRDIDEQFRLLFGAQAFLTAEMEVNNQ